MGWVRRLAGSPAAAGFGRSAAAAAPGLSAAGPDGPPREGPRARCRRAGRAYDQAFGATDTHFLVYEAGPFLLVSNSWGSDDLVLDRGYRVLIRFVVE